MLIKAGIFSEVDKITGVAANIMLGQIPPCGTGETEVLLDEFKLLNNMAMETIPEEVQADVEDACNVDSLTFDFRAPSKNDKDDIHEISAIDIKLI
jgi:hypothetical protein